MEAERAKRSLREYVNQAWEIVEPGRKFISNWHIDAICGHLEAVSRGELRQLLINIPPRFMKSLTVSVFWMTWEWIDSPEMRYLCASYADTLSTRDSLKCRRIITSKWYQDRWGDKFRLTGDQNLKHRFENDKTGYRLATSVGGSATGEGGDRIIVDDPHKVDEAESDTIRLGVIDWWDGTMTTRGNNPDTVAKVIVMQRLHQEDLAGHLLDKGGWEHLCLPMEYEGQRYIPGIGWQEGKNVTAIGWSDPREEIGELLWPERFSPAVVEGSKRDLGSYKAAGQLQQRPSPAGGGKFKRHWFGIVEEVPAGSKKVRYWDFAATEPKPGRKPDWTAGCKMSEKDGIFYIEDIRRAQLSPRGVDNLVAQTASLDGKATDQWWEEEGGASGKFASDHILREVLKGYTARPDRVSGSKEVRANPLSAAAEAGNVKLVKGAWNNDFLDELEVFPFGANDDQVDAASGAHSKLAAPKEWGLV